MIDIVCDRCGERRATVVLTVATSRGTESYRLCEECADEVREEWVERGLEGAGIFKEEIADHGVDWDLPLSRKQARELICPNCGLTYEELMREGRFGCSECYSFLEPAVGLLLERIHGVRHHVGKRPRKQIHKPRGKRDGGSPRD